ncbi:MAG: diaminopimelate epimerase [Taibaiella sp.]|nr:diaminopimelate epimerase [Taibaiella sp.]
MRFPFYKYQGAGNDFILIDNRTQGLNLSPVRIAELCDRRFGIGADGLMYLKEEQEYDFRMVYFNADGHESTMCGNGGRCMTLFAHDLGVIGKHADFAATDGRHRAEVLEDGMIALGMIDVPEIRFGPGETVLDTGSPHIVIPVSGLASYDVYQNGKRIRNEERFGPKGINVNFTEGKNHVLHIRTYERGVEDETLACGTGVTAAAISSVGKQVGKFSIPVQAAGGKLQVDFQKTSPDSAEQITLTGPAKFVFKGEIDLEG